MRPEQGGAGVDGAALVAGCGAQPVDAFGESGPRLPPGFGVAVGDLCGDCDDLAELRTAVIGVTGGAQRLVVEGGILEEFERAWRPAPYPQGMLRAFAYWSDDGQEITGVSFWDSEQACASWRASEPEARRRAAMAPYVVEEREGFYRGRELAVPQRSRGRAGQRYRPA
ncbi:hypothetical protein ACWEGX_22680 [Streptomyces chartreusis]